ncbi:MAG: hypothetical protein ABJA81_08670, partial [Nocardioidaceae bacterium]
VLLPASHRVADDTGLDAVVTGKGGCRVGIRPCADDQQIRPDIIASPEGETTTRGYPRPLDRAPSEVADGRRGTEFIREELGPRR